MFSHICHIKSYLLHRFEIHNDVHHWSQISSDSDLGYIFHQDISENIICSLKSESQDALFSSKQTSLHCTVVYDNEKVPKYSYHISDSKGHDSAFTLLVTKDWTGNFNDSENYPFIRIKSDNFVKNITVFIFLKLI